MTTVTVKASTQGWEWAWDSRATMGDSMNITLTNKYSKVFRNDYSKLIFGVAGSFAVANLLKYAKFPEYRPEGHGSAEEYISHVLMPEVKAFMRESGVMGISNGLEDIECQLLVQINERMFYLGGDFSWFEINDKFSIGSGSPYAFGALSMDATARHATQIAAQFDGYTANPIYSEVF